MLMRVLIENGIDVNIHMDPSVLQQKYNDLPAETRRVAETGREMSPIRSSDDAASAPDISDDELNLLRQEIHDERKLKAWARNCQSSENTRNYWS